MSIGKMRYFDGMTKTTRIRKSKLTIKKTQRIEIDSARLYWLLGQIIAKERRLITWGEFCAMSGLSFWSLRKIMAGERRAGLQTLEKLISFMRSRGIIVHPSDFLVDVEEAPSPTTAQNNSP